MKTASEYERFEAALAEMEPDQREWFESLMANARSVEIIWKECAKVKYGHKETAEQAADSMHRKTGDSYDAYHCGECEAWHIGHTRC